MENSNANSGNDFFSYAQFCLKLAAQTPDRASRLMLREMAAQWLKLVDDRQLDARRDGLDGNHRGRYPDAAP